MKKLFSVISTFLLVVLIGLALAITGPLLIGYKEMSVLSGSMEPKIPVGSIVYVKPGVDPTTLSKGDIVTYTLSDDVFVTHRVVSVDKASRTIVTKGDANDAEDGEIDFSKVYGKADFHLPYLGYISMWIRKPMGIMAITVLIVVVILLNFLPYLLSSEKESEKRGVSDFTSSKP